MIKKILIAEDIDSINTGIISLLQENFDFEIEHANSCDNAFIKLTKAKQDHQPFDLLISDISFKTSGFLTPKISNGIELVQQAKQTQQALKTLIYTIEDKPAMLNHLINDVEVNGIVLKGLQSLKELSNAIITIKNGEDYFSQEVLQIIKNKSTTDIEEYDITLLDFLSKGYTQEQISVHLKEKQITPSSTSAIEKRINRLKIILKAKNNIQMVAIAKDLALI